MKGRLKLKRNRIKDVNLELNENHIGDDNLELKNWQELYDIAKSLGLVYSKRPKKTVLIENIKTVNKNNK